MDQIRKAQIFIVRSFFALWFIQSINNVEYTFTALKNGTPFNWLWPLGWIPNEASKSAIVLIFAILLAGHALAVFFPTRRLARFCAAVSILMICSAPNSFGKIMHSDINGILIAFLLAFYPETRNQPQQLIVRRCQSFLLSIYFAAGLWKLLSLLDAITKPDFFGVLAATLPVHMAGVYSEDAVVNLGLLNWFSTYPLSSALAWIGAVTLECSVVLWFFKRNLDFAWGCLLVFFHTANVFILGFKFNGQMLLVILLFIIWPLFFKFDDEPQSA